MDETGVVASLALHVVLEPIFAEVSFAEKTVVAYLCPYVVVTNIIQTFTHTFVFDNTTLHSLNQVRST